MKGFVYISSTAVYVPFSLAGLEINPQKQILNLDVQLRSPTEVGKLPANELFVLWNYYKFIAKYWGNSKYLRSTNLDSFSKVMALKTLSRPSYLYEYRSAIHIMSYGERKPDYNRFFTNNIDAYSTKFVTLEFLRLNISSGGFKVFGYKNYVGYAGGRFDDPIKIPYSI